MFINKNVEPLNLSSEITDAELNEAQQKDGEKEEMTFEKEPLSKKLNIVNRLLRYLWYKRSVSDEDDELENNKALDNHIEKKILS
ncbi:unnamed protein product, partial [Rotaria magnacalcarata]